MTFESYSNCSVYYLPHGSLELYDQAGDLVFGSTNETIHLPVIYVTNCSADYQEVYDYYYEKLANSLQDPDFIINQSVDKYTRSLVAVAFAFSAIVVSSWMLFIVLFLSTNKKPISIKLANALYAVAVSVVLHQATYHITIDTKVDIQEVARFQDQVLNGLIYSILMVITQAVTWVAWLEIIAYITPVPYERRTVICGILMCVANIIMLSLDSFYRRDNAIYESANSAVEVLMVISHVAIQVAFTVLVILYTVKKNRIAYNKRTMPLALVTLCFLVTPFIFYILMRYSAAVQDWAGVFFKLGQIICGALVWEWIADIEVLSREIEFSGVVGREIDNDSSSTTDPPAPRGKLQFWRRRKETRKVVSSGVEENYELDNIESFFSSDSGEDGHSYEEAGSTMSHSVIDSLQQEYARINNNNVVVVEADLEFSDDDDDDDGDDDGQDGQDGHLHETLPPAFEPHPNFNIGDYWHEEKGHL